MNSMSNYIKTGDLRVLSIFNQNLNCLLLDVFMNTITKLGSFVFALTLPLVLLFSGEVTFILTGIRMVMVLAISEAMVFVVKRLVHRPRPFRVLDNVINTQPTNCPYSFPSGHTCAAFSLALVLAASFPGINPVLLTLASLVGCSRVYLGVHYPTDVMVGGITAYAAFQISSKIFF